MTQQENNISITHKEDLYSFLLVILEVSGNSVRYSKNFDEDYKNRLKFQKQTDWRKYRACVDLLCDTEYAIMEAFRYQLGDIRHKNRIGEIYLRLYGILNAVYLQIKSLDVIMKLLNFSKRKEFNEQLEHLEIYKLRGIAGSHTVDYLYDKGHLTRNPDINKTTSFRVAQYALEKRGNRIIAVDENGGSFQFNLIEVLTEYERIETMMIIEIIKHGINKLISNKEGKKKILADLNEKMKDLIDYSKENFNEISIEKINSY